MGRTSTTLAQVAIPLAGVIATAQLYAAVPHFMTEQGRLFDATGKPVDTAALKQAFVFTIYDAATGGNVLWTESQNISIADGYFSAVLGQDTPIDPSIFDGTTRYLGIKVATDAEMTPRQPLSSVPYAMVAENATGDITPTTVTVNKVKVIDKDGNWTGNATGLQGPQGDVGAKGPQGVPGGAGPQGVPGGAGPQGDVGAKGPQGVPGGAGPQGVPGGAGPQGAAGGAGPQGAVGPQGAQGAIGASGIVKSSILTAGITSDAFGTVGSGTTVVGQSAAYVAGAGETALAWMSIDCAVSSPGTFLYTDTNPMVSVNGGAFAVFGDFVTNSALDTKYHGISTFSRFPLASGSSYVFGLRLLQGTEDCYSNTMVLITH